MKILPALLLILSFLISMVGCASQNTEQPTSDFIGSQSIAEETTYPESDTAPSFTPKVQIDYIGETPTEAELHDFFKSYAYEAVKARMSQEEVQYCGHVDNYAIVLLRGMGPKIMLYEFAYSDGRIQVLSQADGSLALSGGLSINHIERDGQHIYFGSCSDYHWDSIADKRIPIDWLELRVFGENNESTVIDMSGKSGYLCIVNTPMTDFQVVDQSGTVCLDYAAFFDQKYLMDEREFYSIQE